MSSRNKLLLRSALPVGLLTIGIMATTLALPWWSVAVAGLLYGWLIPAARAWQAGAAGLVAWSVLLLVAAVEGPVGVLAGRLGVLFHVPGAVLLLVTVLFAAVLGWGGAGVGKAISRKL
ncbi:MAG: hypothetical protein ABJC74_17800 [Gemmatimonadota bacterium]